MPQVGAENFPLDVEDIIEVNAADVGDAVADAPANAEEDVDYLKDIISDIKADNNANANIVEDMQVSALDNDPQHCVAAVDVGKDAETSNTTHMQFLQEKFQLTKPRQLFL